MGIISRIAQTSNHLTIAVAVTDIKEDIEEDIEEVAEEASAIVVAGGVEAPRRGGAGGAMRWGI